MSQSQLLCSDNAIKRLSSSFVFYFLILFFALPTIVFAAGNCSPYLGHASLNEFFKNQTNMAYDPTDFVEVKLLDPSINSAIFSTWKIRICEQNLPGNNNDADGCSFNFSLGTFNTSNYPWITLSGNIGRYVNFKTGFDALLVDGNGDVIDYLTVDNYKPQEKSGCTGIPPLQFDYQASSPGASDKFIYRTPDGTGDWGSAASASALPTQNNTNDTAPGGGTPPVISVANVTVNKGDTATFTFTLEKSVPYDVSVNYVTEGGTAIAYTTASAAYDYVSKTGTITFAANTTTLTQTLDIVTSKTKPSTTNAVYFYLKLYNQINAQIVNAFPVGTILGNATSNWYMDEIAWTNQKDQVTDSGGSNNHGTPYKNVTTINPGKLCNAGSFDGNNDYVEVPNSSSLIGTDQLTYAAWINPASWSNTTINQVMAKSVHGGGSGRAQMGIFSENGRLVGRAETNAGRYEVYTQRPALSTWTYVTLVFSGNSLTLYINGAVAPNADSTHFSSKTFTSTTLKSNTDPLMISKRVGSNQYYFHGMIDEALVMQSALPGSFIKTMYDNYQNGKNWDGAGRACPGSLHHIEIIHDGSALTCNPEQVTVRACSDSAVPCTAYTSSVTLSLLPTGWVGGDTKTFTSSTGEAIYNLRHTLAETVTLNASNINPLPSSSTVICRNSAGGAAVPCTLTFSDSGFIFRNDTDSTSATTSNTSIPVQLSGKNSDTGYHAKNISIRAVKKSATDPTQCAPAYQDKDFTLDFATKCINPSACITGQQLSLTTDTSTGTFTGLVNTTASTLPLDNTSYSSRTVHFGTNGESKVVINYPEAGQLELHARQNLLSADGAPSGNYITGSTTFIVRPLGFSLGGLSYAANETGTVFTQAGEPFATTLTAIAWQAADDINNDGIPDSGATLTDNFTTHNFGKETTAVTPANVSVTHTTTMPNTGNLTNTANGASFVNGVGNKTLAWDEVGVIDLNAKLSNYLSGGDDITGSAHNVGRFNPHHFDTLVTHGCSSIFTYSGQPFAVTTYARNKGGSTTLNYSGNYAFGVALTDANPAATPTGLFSNNSIGTVSFTSTASTDGSSTGVGTTSTIKYTFTNKDTIPDKLEIRATDVKDTAISSSGFTEGYTEIRSGRMRLENTYGPELTSLSMPVRTEYYSDNTLIGNTADDGFILNTDDSCTSYDASADPLYNYTGSLSAGDTTVSGPGNITAGSGKLIFSAPVGKHTGSVILLAKNAPTWLTYTWNVDCDNADGDNNITTGIDAGLCGPFGLASFGLYRGDDRVIYWKELF